MLLRLLRLWRLLLRLLLLLQLLLWRLLRLLRLLLMLLLSLLLRRRARLRHLEWCSLLLCVCLLHKLRSESLLSMSTSRMRILLS